MGGLGSGGHNFSKYNMNNFPRIDSFNCNDWKNLTVSKVLNNYGGFKYYFICPSCNNRFRFLYSRGNIFKCRKCHRLSYPTTRRSKASIPSLRMRSILINKLKADITGLCIRELADYVPDKPKGMHWNTYNKWLKKLNKAQEDYKKGRFIK